MHVSRRRSASDQTGLDRPIRVMYVGHTAKLSGGEIALSRLIEALGDRVQPLAVLAEDGPLVGRLEKAGVQVRILPLSASTKDVHKDEVAGPLPIARRVGSVLLYAIRLRRLIRLERVDVVHTNTLKAGFYGCLAARLAGKPSVWHVRDRLAADYLPRFAIGMTRLALAVLPQRIICNSSSTLDTVVPPRARWVGSRAIVAASPIFDVLESGEPPSVSTRGEGDATRIAMVGRIAPWKGQLVAVRAFARAALPPGSTLVLFGSPMFGEDSYLGEIEAEIQRLGLQDSVVLRGFVEDVSSELRGMDILVHASLSPEPFGQVIVEGLAAGVAVVATAGGGPSEILTDGQDGLLYKAGDESQLAETLHVLSRDHDLRSRLAQAGRLRARDFSPSVIGPRVFRVYEELTGSRDDVGSLGNY